MSDPIRITREELSSPAVDARIAEQQSFGFAAAPEAEVPQPLWFKPWFALMVAGLLAALLSWGLLEPWMDDGFRFVGRIQGVQHAVPGEESGLADRSFEVNGIQVIVLADAMVLTQDGRETTVSTLASGDVVEVLASRYFTSSGKVTRAVARYLRQRPASTKNADAEIDLDALSSRDSIATFLLFPLTAALIGLFLGATDGLLSRVWSRAALAGAIGFVTGFLGGILAAIPAGLIYQLGSKLAWSAHGDSSTQLSGRALLIQIMGRALAWAVVGFAAGMGLGIAARSRKLFANGVIGGTVGALFGGILFDPINLGLEHLVRTGGAELSRMIGIGLIGAAAGVMIGVVELVARESWVRILTGPIAGKEFILYRNPTWIGSSPKSEIFLFKDAHIAPRHAAIHRVGEHYEIEDQGSPAGTVVSGGRVKRRRLRDHDRIHVGETILEFRLRDE